MLASPPHVLDPHYALSECLTNVRAGAKVAHSWKWPARLPPQHMTGDALCSINVIIINVIIIIIIIINIIIVRSVPLLQRERGCLRTCDTSRIRLTENHVFDNIFKINRHDMGCKQTSMFSHRLVGYDSNGGVLETS